MKPPDLARLGWTAGHRWYADSLPAVHLVGAGDIRLGAALLAATSPRCQLSDNLRRALKRESPLPTHKLNINRALAGRPLSGPKVSAFARALAGDITAVTIDTWLCKAYNINPKLSLGDYHKLACRISTGASRARTNPRDYAASVWCGTLLAHGRTVLNYGDALRRLTA